MRHRPRSPRKTVQGCSEVRSEARQLFQSQCLVRLRRYPPPKRSDALLHFAKRSSAQNIDPDEHPFALMICTDGIRKSCASDDDFLTLADYLVSEASGSDADGECTALDVDLNRITTEGSGDDVSVAIDIHGQLKPETEAGAK